VDAIQGFVDPFTTDARRGLLTQLSSPWVKYQLSAGEVVSVTAVLSVAF
jgi:hypothetical protein